MRSRVEKPSTFLRIWARYFEVRRLLRSYRLPEVAERLSGTGDPWSMRDVRAMSRAVSRTLRGPVGPIRCLPRALVLYSLLREHGTEAEIVIGVQTDSSSHEAHAWVEVDGVDVGPRPGRAGRAELVRYPHVKGGGPQTAPTHSS